MILRANCKINIGLDVLRRREDRFHDLDTVMIPVLGLYDEVRVEPRLDSLDVTFEGVGLVVDCPAEDNLCVRAARLVQSRYDTAGVAITLDKRVPFGAGLGGGSSDATAVIVAMNEIFELRLPEEVLISLAAEIGSDTAFFVRNTPQLCTGRGEIMSPIELDLAGLTLVLIKPEGVNVSTREAYGGVRPTCPEHSLRELLAEPIEQWQGRVKNDFEPRIFEAYPLLAQIKSDLLDAGALYAAMSGSGSTIFGLFRNPQDAKSEQLESYSPYVYAL
ncbi:MAG: 4-(cytidine 5'-diphospho)-2-C-methyl-D-erythritol kinase [Rikenellaceae bacterium]